jgi:hypothetical protein
MNEEYLWNKTGSDPKIERLEKALAVFRHRESAMPPVFAVAEDVRPARRWRFPLAFAFAACAAIVFVAVVWVQLARTSSEAGDMVTYVAHPVVDEEAAPTAQPEAAPYAEPRPAKPALSAPRRAKQKVEATVAKTVRRPKQIHRDNRAPQGIASLTKEERYAYDQLMLALSITSSKLKIVQDTINGTDPENTNER